VGRKTTYTPEIGVAICERMSEGESLRAICKTAGMPPRRTIMAWKRNNKEFQAMYREARQDLVEFWADEIIEIADDSSKDYAERVGRNGEIVQAVDHDHITRSRLMVDTRKFLMGKLHPEYADRVEHTGAGGGPIETRELSDIETADRLLGLVIAAQKKDER
jgi:hypothetical protein